MGMTNEEMQKFLNEYPGIARLDLPKVSENDILREQNQDASRALDSDIEIPALAA